MQHDPKPISKSSFASCFSIHNDIFLFMFFWRLFIYVVRISRRWLICTSLYMVHHTIQLFLTVEEVASCEATAVMANLGVCSPKTFDKGIRRQVYPPHPVPLLHFIYLNQ